MKATSYCLVLLSLSFAASTSVGSEQSTGGPATNKGDTTAYCCFISPGIAPSVYFKMEGEDTESKYVGIGSLYGRLYLNVLCNRLYRVRFEPPDDYSFVPFFDHRLKMSAIGYDGQEGKTLNPVPAIMLALPVPSTPFYFKNHFAPPNVHCPQVHSMAEFNAAATTVWYLKPAEKGAPGLYSNSNLYVKFYSGVQLVLEDSTIKPTVSLIEPKDGETISGIIIAQARVPDKLGMQGIEFSVDGVGMGADWTEFGNNCPTYHLQPARAVIDTRLLPDEPHEMAAVVIFTSGVTLSSKATVNVKNAAPAPSGAPTDTSTNE